MVCMWWCVDVNFINLFFCWHECLLVSAPTVKGSGEYGILYLAEPLDACTELTNKVEQLPNASSPFALVVRGGCSFEEKVRRAQKAGFKAVIVYDNEDGGILVASNDQFLYVATFCCLSFSSHMQLPSNLCFLQLLKIMWVVMCTHWLWQNGFV